MTPNNKPTSPTVLHPETLYPPNAEQLQAGIDKYNKLRLEFEVNIREFISQIAMLDIGDESSIKALSTRLADVVRFAGLI